MRRAVRYPVSTCRRATRADRPCHGAASTGTRIPAGRDRGSSHRRWRRPPLSVSRGMVFRRRPPIPGERRTDSEAVARARHRRLVRRRGGGLRGPRGVPPSRRLARSRGRRAGARRPPRVPVSRLHLRRPRRLRRDPLRPAAPVGEADGLRDPGNPRPRLRLVGHRRTPAAMAPSPGAPGGRRGGGRGGPPRRNGAFPRIRRRETGGAARISARSGFPATRRRPPRTPWTSPICATCTATTP